MDQEIPGPARGKKTFVLCFDGTGNKFMGDESDSNILKIYRMLDRADGSTFTFYQPGIGTYVSTNHMETTGTIAKIKSWYTKSKDAAVGSSFAEHVMGGYQFLMRYYSSEDDLYFFGFSRGAYTARFLAEMLDHVGLLSAGNEELARFAWKTYAKWASRKVGDSPEDKTKEKDLYLFMRGFRETFSRRVRRIRFLGLFDTVNSVPAFEGAWMQRSKFPYTARSSAKVIRHAVSIDERRAKFRQDLVAGSKEDYKKLQSFQSPSQPLSTDGNDYFDPASVAITKASTSAVPSINIQDASPERENFGAETPVHAGAQTTAILNTPRKLSMATGEFATRSTEDLQQQIHDAKDASIRHKRRLRRWSDMSKDQDILEVWFPGGHGDIGGGWKRATNETRMLSHTPLIWMVHEAEKAGLRFDGNRMSELNVLRGGIDEFGERYEDEEALKSFFANLKSSGETGNIHDCLNFGCGLGKTSVLAWKLMEYLPFRRMDLQKDGSWKAIRWPLPCGETRDIPLDAKIHVSAIRRMEANANYRPGNLIIGGGGRGIKVAPEEYGIGSWNVFVNHGDPVHEVYVKRENESRKK